MTDTERKLNQLQACLGEKKLKQLGLIPCSTCRKILTQVMNITLPTDLENKTFLTSNEMATINQSILDATDGYLKNTPVDDYKHSMRSAFTSTASTKTSDIKTASNLPHQSEANIAPYSSNQIHSDQDLLDKLLEILNQPHHIVQDHCGIGYTYVPPTPAPIADALSCCECGRLFVATTHPKFKLTPLPVSLTDTEYELIKGVYVDILL